MPPTLDRRLAALDWPRLEADLDAQGFALTGPLLGPAECARLAGLYDQEGLFRKHIHMARHGFGQGEYKYFAHPLPETVSGLRAAIYPRLAKVANRWVKELGGRSKFPPSLDAYLKRCHRAGQRRPTPLLLRYGAGDYNCLHQDLYGELVFPLQMTVLLSAPGRDFEGGEFILVEQRPRRQSKAAVAPLGLGEAVIFAVRERPQSGARGIFRVTLRHGVSRLRSGHRHALGVIFHDAA